MGAERSLLNPADQKLVSVVIGSFDRKRFLRLTIESVREELTRLGSPGEIIVIDGGSTDGSVSWLARQKDVITIVQHNRGDWRDRPVARRSWGYFMNLGFKCAQGKFVCLLSDDCLLVPGALQNGCALFEERLLEGEPVGAVAFYWRNWPEQERYWVGKTFGERMHVNHGLYLREALEEIGYADEEAFYFYHADSDICLRLADRGFSCIAGAGSFVEHYSYANVAVRKSNSEHQRRDWATYVDRWAHLGEPESDWLEISFQDPNQIARRFKRRFWFNH